LSYLTLAVILVGALCVFDLVLSLGIIRRLREQNETLARLSARHVGSDATVPVGEPVGEFTATTLGGAVVSRDGSDRHRLVGFFSPGCRPCEEQLPEFVQRATEFPGHVLAVVVAENGHADEYAGRLAPIADVVVEPSAGPLAHAFAVTSVPALCLVASNGTVVASGRTMAAIPDPARL